MRDFGTPVATLTAARPAATETVPGWTVWLMRLVVTLWAVLVLSQPVLAGQFLDGNDDLVYVPLGVLLFGVAVVMVRWVWTSDIRVHRSHARVTAE